MSIETTALGLAALLQTVQIGLAAMSMKRDGLSKWNASPRDAEPDFSERTNRLRRAVNNHFEGLIFFTIAVVLVVLADAGTVVTAVCSCLYLIARVLYIPAYAYGWSPGRSIIWAVGFLSTLTMIILSLL